MVFGAMWYIYVDRLCLMHPSDCYGAVGFIAMPIPLHVFLSKYIWRFLKVFGDKITQCSKERARRSKHREKKVELATRSSQLFGTKLDSRILQGRSYEVLKPFWGQL